MPMAGMGSRFAERGYKDPKPLIKILDKTILEWSITTLGLEGNYIFCCKSEHIEKFDLDKKLKKLVPNCKVISISYQTEGTLQTILEVSNLIDSSEELVISDSDHYLIWDVEKFNQIRKYNIDGCVMVFPDKQTSNALSYVKLDNQGYVIKSAEKTPISEIATVGVHYFKHGSDFVNLAQQMIDENIRHNNEFYVTPIYNLFAKLNKKIITLPVKKMWALGNPEEVDIFLSEFKESNS